MKEVIVCEWRDNLGIVHRDEKEELIRCGNCAYAEPNDACDSEIICRNNGCAWDKMGFCSDAERKYDEY